MLNATQRSAETREAVTVPTYPPLESITKPGLTTPELAHYSNLKQQTLRENHCYGKGQFRAKRIGNRLFWDTKIAKSVLLGVS